MNTCLSEETQEAEVTTHLQKKSSHKAYLGQLNCETEKVYCFHQEVTKPKETEGIPICNQSAGTERRQRSVKAVSNAHNKAA